MHSSLRRELCGTPRILQSIRARSTSRPSSRTRKFSNRPCLLSQPGSQDDNTKPSESKSSPSNNPNDPAADSKSVLQEVSADILRWCQTMSDLGYQPDLVNVLTEKDEHGKRRLSPTFNRIMELEGPRIKELLRSRAISSQNHEDEKRTQSSGLGGGESRKRTFTQPGSQREAEINVADSSLIEGISLHSGRVSSTETAEADQRLKKSRETNEQSDSIAEKQLEDQTEPSQELAPQVQENNPVSKFHGSSAARRQRERQSRIKERSSAVVLPDWFTESNVQVRDDAKSSPSTSETIQDPEATDTNEQHIPTVNQAHAEVPETKVEAGEAKTQDDTATEKLQAHGSGSGTPLPPHVPLSSQSGNGLTALSPPEKRYYIQTAQLIELLATIKGRLTLPAHGSPATRPGGIRSHLLVHYLANDGDLFLDRLVQDITRMLNCNLITLDAQDISALISKTEIDPMLVEEAKMLGYEIYSEVYADKNIEEDHTFMASDDMEEVDENNNLGMPQGVPFMVGKPITIDLKALFGPRDREFPRRNRQQSLLSKAFTPELMGRGSMPKPNPPMFHSVVESILSSNDTKKTSTDSGNIDKDASESSQNNSPLHRNTTIVHVKDLKAIQETSIGKQFLTQLYYQVERRRNFGETIMIVGTSCDRGNTTHYDADKIRAMQVSEADEISSTIVITPAYPAHRTASSTTDEESEIREELQRTTIPKQDRETRLKIINGRHLFEILRSKDVSLEYLKDGFWTQDIRKVLDRNDQKYLGKSFWSFSHIQRVAALLATGDYSSSVNPIYDVSKILEQSDELKYNWVKEEQSEKSRVKTRPGGRDPQHDKLAQIRAKATKHESKLLSGVVEPQKIKTTFSDIHIPADTVEALQTLTTLSLVRPDAFKYGVLASDRIPGLLLYGPPGTGKTLAAKAVARESGATMLEVSAADINDMYVGEGEKNVKALFSLARKLSPCIVFLDEADAMFRARANDSRRASHRELLNQFLKEWDGMSNDSGSAFIMVATNRPMDLDDAVLRRLPRRLLVDLPTEKDRQEILKIHLRHEHLADDVDLAKLASRTQFYSGSDLKNVAVAAALDCVQEENRLAKQHTSEEDPYQYPKKRTLTAAHFEKALQEISASISEDMASLKDIKKFDEQYGDRKGRRKRSAKWGFKTAAEADAVLDTVKVRS